MVELKLEALDSSVAMSLTMAEDFTEVAISLLIMASLIVVSAVATVVVEVVVEAVAELLSMAAEPMAKAFTAMTWFHLLSELKSLLVSSWLPTALLCHYSITVLVL